MQVKDSLFTCVWLKVLNLIATLQFNGVNPVSFLCYLYEARVWSSESYLFAWHIQVKDSLFTCVWL
jgi:hypothetical protein